MANNILNKTVTYSSLINAAATSLYNKLSGSSVSADTYRNNSFTFTIGAGHVNKAGASSAKKVTLTETENRESYTAPTKIQIVDNINTFMSGLGIPTNDTTPTPDGIISFFFALNFFVEKAVIKRAITAPNNTNSTYHLHYKAPSSSSYTSIPHNYAAQNTITEEKITNIYNQIKTTSLLSDNARGVKISSAAHTSSCSSSSCSSSCSSSSFIVYFNLN